MAPVYSMGEELFKYLRRLARQLPRVQLRQNRVAIFPGGGLIEVRSADDPDKLRGSGLDLVLLDEATGMHPKASKVPSMVPRTFFRDARILGVVTTLRPPRIGNEHIPGPTVLGDGPPKVDAASGGAVRKVHVAHVEPDDLRQAEGGAEGEGEDGMVSGVVGRGSK